MAFTAWFALCMGGAAPAEAGAVRVEVVDAELALALPGVTVVFEGADGSQVAVVTDDRGLAVLELPEGVVRVLVRRDGFRPVVLDGLRVPAAGDVGWTVRLVTEPVLEVVTTRSGAVGVKEFLQKIPTGRSYQSAVQQVSGVAVGAGGSATGAGGESYAHPGHGPLVMAEQDSRSTFATDVDTASYAIARVKLEGGTLPDPAGVRVEEFVNAFPYAYGPPRGTEPFAIHLEAAPHPLRGDRTLLSVALQARPAPLDPPPMHLTFLVDVSGSMASADKLPLAQQALHHLVNGLGADDELALVTYAGRTEIALEPSSTEEAPRIHAAIDGLSSGGGTAMHDGIGLAYTLASRMYRPGFENRVVILTDGDPNIGVASPEGLLDLVHRWAGRGIGLSVVGFGQGNLGDALLETLADHGDGNYHYVDSRQEAEKVFGRDLVANLSTVARDVKVQVEFPEDAVLAWRQVGYEDRAVADEDFRDDAVDGGEIGWGHQVTALYELVLRDRPEGPLAVVRARAEPAGPEAAAREFTASLVAGAVGGTWSGASSALRWATAAATFAEVLRGSPYEAETSFGQVASLVAGAADPDRADHAELSRLVEVAARLSGTSPVAPHPVALRAPPPGRYAGGR